MQINLRHELSCLKHLLFNIMTPKAYFEYKQTEANSFYMNVCMYAHTNSFTRLIECEIKQLL